MSFPNRTGNNPDNNDVLLCELKAAGIPSTQDEEPNLSDNLKEMLTKSSGEVKAWVRGHLYGWTFTRAWKYWMAKGPGIEASIADELYKQFPGSLRVDGHCGCPTPRGWYHGLAVGHYHIDSPEALKGLADAIKEIVHKSEEIEKTLK